MRRTKLVALATASLLSAGVTLAVTTTQAGAAPADTTHYSDPGAPALGKVVSDVRNPSWEENLADRNQAALEKRLRQGGTGDSVKLGKGKYGRVGTPQTDRIFVVLAEFGDTQHSAYSGPAPDGSSQRELGPLHNEIPEPDRSVDDSTLWQADYDHAHYQNMYFYADEEVLRGPVQRPLLDRRRRHRVGQGAVQRGPATVATTAATSSARARTS